MYLLDNDIFELYLLGEANTVRHVKQHRQITRLSSVAAEERIGGYLNGINRARKENNSLSLPQAHEDFVEALNVVQQFPLFAYSEEAHAIYQTFPPSILRVGTQDCRIAAQAMAHGMVVVTRNVRDFNAIGATCLDWSAV